MEFTYKGKTLWITVEQKNDLMECRLSEGDILSEFKSMIDNGQV